MVQLKNDELISLRLPKELLAKLDRLADKEHRSRANLMRLLLEKALS